MDENQKEDYYAAPYCNEGGSLCYIPARENATAIRLCNFAPRIVKELIEDDGAKKTRYYLIGGTDADGKEIEPIKIPAGELEKMNWVADNLDASCDICIVPQVEKHMRCAIKSTATYAEKQYIFSHTGWEKIDGAWRFLLPEYENNIVVLKGKQKNYFGADNGSNDDVKAVSNLLSSGIMPDEVLLPCLAITFLSPLNEFFKQVGYEPKFLLTLIGRTGSMKSTVAALMLSFFGQFSATDLPMSFRDTANSIVHNAFALKDVLTCVDDYHPTAKSEAGQMRNTMQVLARGYGDRAARNRLGADITLREPKPPQGNVIVTAEFLPDIGESGLARLFCIEMQPGCINLPLLTEAQEKARDGCFVRCMSAYLRYLQYVLIKNENGGYFCNLIKESYPNYREEWRGILREKHIKFHDRLPDTLSCLEIGFVTMTKFLCKMDAIDEAEMKALWVRMGNVLITLAKKQSETVEADRPTHIFLRKLFSLIECGQVCLLPAKGTADNVPKSYIGYEDDDYYYLMLDVSHKAVKRLCCEQDEGFAISAKSLAAALADERLIESKDGKNTQPIRFGGKLKRVMLLKKDKANEVVSM